MASSRIRATGKPKREIDVDLLAQAILVITEQQLQTQKAPQGSGEAITPAPSKRESA